MERILFILKVSRYKTTGFYNVNHDIKDSDIIKKQFRAKFLLQYGLNDNIFIPIYYLNGVFSISVNLISLLFCLFTYRPNVVYFSISPVNTFMRDFLYVLVLKQFKVKIVYHLHGKGIREKCKISPFYTKLYEFAYKNVNVICLSKLLTFDISEIFKGTPFIVSNGIEKSINDEMISYRKNNDYVKIIFLSNYIKTKGIFDYLEALSILSKMENLSFEGIIIGQEDEITTDELREYIISKDLQKSVKIKGPKYGLDKYTELLNADIFVFPTYSEAFGLVILEAMQCGLPVVSTFEGSIPEIVDNGKTGYLVEKRNPQQLAEHIKILIGNEELRISMGKSGRSKFLKRYTRETFEKNLCLTLSKILI